jgi:hypothetical protein
MYAAASLYDSARYRGHPAVWEGKIASLRPWPGGFMQDSAYGFPRRPQAVEKVVVGPIGSLKQLQNTSKPLRNTTKPGFKALDQGLQNHTREFFNTLTPSSTTSLITREWEKSPSSSGT